MSVPFEINPAALRGVAAQIELIGRDVASSAADLPLLPPFSEAAKAINALTMVWQEHIATLGRDLHETGSSLRQSADAFTSADDSAASRLDESR